MMNNSRSVEDQIHSRADVYPTAPTALSNYSLATKSLQNANASHTTMSKYLFPSIQKMLNNNSTEDVKQ